MPVCGLRAILTFCGFWVHDHLLEIVLVIENIRLHSDLDYKTKRNVCNTFITSIKLK